MTGTVGTGSGGSGDPLAAIRNTLAHVRDGFGGLSHADCEDAVSEAYLQLLDRQVAGKHVANPERWLRKAASRRASDAVRRRARQAQAVDDESLAGIADPDQGAHERMLARGVIARFVAAVHLLPAEQREALRLAAEWRRTGYAREHRPWKRLGITRSAYFYRVSQGMDKPIADATADYAPRLDAWVKQTITASLAGCVDRADARRLMLLVREDPKVAAVYRELSRAHDVAAATLPPLAITEATDPSLVERFGAGLERGRDALASAFGRGEPADLATPIASSGGVRGAGTAGAAALAKIAAVGGAGKVAGCLGGAAAVTACVAAGVLSVPGFSDRDGSNRERTIKAAESGSSEEQGGGPAPVSIIPSQIGYEEPEQAPAPNASEPAEQEESAPEEPASQPIDYLAPSTPPVEREFGVAPAGTPVQSAGSSPSTSGGAGATTPASASDVQREFGP